MKKKKMKEDYSDTTTQTTLQIYKEDLKAAKESDQK